MINIIVLFSPIIKTILHLFNIDSIDIVSLFTIESDIKNLILKALVHFYIWFFMLGLSSFLEYVNAYYFGNMLQNIFGDRLIYRVFNGVLFGGLLYVISYNIFPVFKGNVSQMIGASAGVMAMLFYLSSYSPNMRIRFFIIDIKLIYIALFLLILLFKFQMEILEDTLLTLVVH